MKTYRQIVFLILDELKINSDDSNFNEEHIIFMANKYRAALLKKTYSDIKKEIPQDNYQTLCLDLEESEGLPGFPCEGTYMKSTKKIPDTIEVGHTTVSTDDYFSSNISFVSRDRFKYVGYNKWLKNIIYATIGTDNYLYLKSDNPQLYYLEEAKITGIFSDIEEASKLECDEVNTCDILDMKFPLEDALIPTMIELILKDIAAVIYKPEDDNNNANDDLGDMSKYIALNAKSDLAKAITN